MKSSPCCLRFRTHASSAHATSADHHRPEGENRRLRLCIKTKRFPTLVVAYTSPRNYQFWLSDLDRLLNYTAVKQMDRPIRMACESRIVRNHADGCAFSI